MRETRKDEVPTNTKCPRCGYVTADPFNCAMCKMEPNARIPTPPEQGKEAYNYLAEVVEGAAHEFSRQAMWDKTGRADFYCAHLKEAAGRLRSAARATPPAAETGEPVAWTLRFKPTGQVCAWLSSAERETMDAACVAHNEDSEDAPYEVIPLYAAPAPREVSEDTARLDWLEANSSAYHSAIEMEHHAHLHGDINEPLRQRIDATRAALSAETGTPVTDANGEARFTPTPEQLEALRRGGLLDVAVRAGGQTMHYTLWMDHFGRVRTDPPAPDGMRGTP